jgi:DNA-binding protein Fis
MIDLSPDTMANYKIDDMGKDIVQTCLLEGGDGDLLATIQVDQEDNSTGTPTTNKVSIRKLILDQIKVAVDDIFSQLDGADSAPSLNDVDAMVQLEKLLGLLSTVDSFYSYIHEASEDPPFPSLETYFTSTSPVSKAADYDQRAITDADCVAEESTCAALAVRLRVASMACDDYTVPPDSFDGQPA